MKRNVGSMAAAAAMFFAVSSSAHAAATARQKLDAVQYLVGTWNCAHTVGTFSGTYTTTYTSELGNLWLRQRYDFPQLGESKHAESAEFLFGYDEGRQAWVRFGALSTGQYFAIRMTDNGDTGWSFKYVSFFKRKTPETAASDATFTKQSAAEYTVDGPTYKDESGKPLTEHHVCKKQ